MNDDNDIREASAEQLPCENGLEPERRSSQTTIRDLPINLRIFQALESAGIKTVGELREWSEPQLLKIRNLGRSSLNEIKNVIGDYDVELRHLSAAELNEELTSPRKVKCAYKDRGFECSRTALRGGDLCWSHERIRQGQTGSTPWGVFYVQGRWRNRILDGLKRDAQQMQYRLEDAEKRFKDCKASLAEIDRLIEIIRTLPDDTIKPKGRSANKKKPPG